MFILASTLLLSCTIATSLFLPLLRKYGFTSRDINKLNNYTLIPEPGSIPACLIYLFTIYCLSSERKLSNAIILSLTLGLIIGIIDDYTPLNWGTKILLPILTWIPSRYYFSRPKYLRIRLFSYFDYHLPIAGFFITLYEVFILCIYIFIPNAINIYSGINGLEVSQSLIICLAIHGLGYTECSEDVKLYTLHFIPICLSLLLFNWYPAKMFVGDTFTSFAGILFANIFIIGYNPIKLILFLLPQIVNFLVSIPQLIGFIPCPRHRTPDVKNNGLLASNNNLTLINLVLKLTGPLGERNLVILLLVAQALVGIITHLIVQ